VKICGITSLEDARACIDAGARALGFVFYPKSPRCLTPSQAGAIAAQIPLGVKKVGVFVNVQVDRVLDAILSAGLDMAQLSGDESPEECAWLMARDVKVVKAVRLRGPEDLSRLERYRDHVHAFNVDGYREGHYGGTGATADWSLAREAKALGRPVILSGGIGPKNVAEALRSVDPAAIDVCSSVEREPGKKDVARLRSLFEAIRRFEESPPGRRAAGTDSGSGRVVGGSSSGRAKAPVEPPPPPAGATPVVVLGAPEGAPAPAPQAAPAPAATPPRAETPAPLVEPVSPFVAAARGPLPEQLGAPLPQAAAPPPSAAPAPDAAGLVSSAYARRPAVTPPPIPAPSHAPTPPPSPATHPGPATHPPRPPALPPSTGVRAESEGGIMDAPLVDFASASAAIPRLTPVPGSAWPPGPGSIGGGGTGRRHANEGAREEVESPARFGDTMPTRLGAPGPSAAAPAPQPRPEPRADLAPIFDDAREAFPGGVVVGEGSSGGEKTVKTDRSSVIPLAALPSAPHAPAPHVTPRPQPLAAPRPQPPAAQEPPPPAAQEPPAPPPAGASPVPDSPPKVKKLGLWGDPDSEKKPRPRP
jgi:phosphoribosylanthranilate isomerase